MARPDWRKWRRWILAAGATAIPSGVTSGCSGMDSAAPDADASDGD